MQFVEQSTTLPILNFDTDAGIQKFQRHSLLFGGDSKRGLIVGPSNSGKTNIVISLLLHPNGLRFQNIYLCSQSLKQHKYQYLHDIVSPLKEIGYYEYNDPDTFITPKMVANYSVVIFDDVPSKKCQVIKDYFSFGRHKNVDCFFLCQTYTAIPKALLRDNSNLLVLFRQDLTNLKHIYDEKIIGDMTFEEFQNICRLCWADSYGFLVIDLDCVISNGRYRKGFDKYINL